MEFKGGISAKVIADSISPEDVRLTTLQLRYPRFIHSEFMTHRMFSRNASSSRAIPIPRMVAQVVEDPATPIEWGKNQPGMQARVNIEDPDQIDEARDAWRTAASRTAHTANNMAIQHGLHKQIVNRLLEPFQFMHTVVTATEWDNFFHLRLHPDAQPEIRELARAMAYALEESSPGQLSYTDWHVPYATKTGHCNYPDAAIATKQSVARCARVSYKRHDGEFPSQQEDLALFAKLLNSEHLSPFEHVATPMKTPKSLATHGVTHMDTQGNHWSGNFRGWIQYRQQL